ncbi:hypothetical protein C922_05378 [Plasmodium inui San Antonio 1]|uniref:Uncharacterized protein n=1 Tax=Plasmodium inui San Antonio 1 TaxID=1237626 RepID=W6ZTL3_9APIC|nr:hypothetical protein C922_05378 [Plasmodium inui San Antonio 1]EUD64247.1 hypothetical protein C922_05378 [Plasmodium inui San Antonio 1]
MADGGLSGYIGEVIKEMGCGGATKRASQRGDPKWCRENPWEGAGKRIKSWEESEEGKGRYMTVLQEGTRARSLCKSIDWWMRNIQLNEQRHYEWGQITCTPEATGWLGGNWDQDKCIVDPDQDVWGLYNSGRELRTSQNIERRLSLCMDLMTIFMQVLNDIGVSEEEWISNNEKKDPCDDMYKKLEGWIGPKAGKKVMDDWFAPKSREGQPSQRIIRIENSNKGGPWGEFFGLVKTIAVGLQCSQSADQGAEYMTSCVYRNEDNCQPTPPEDQISKIQEEWINRDKTGQEVETQLTKTETRTGEQLKQYIEKSEPNTVGAIIGGVLSIILAMSSLYGIWRISNTSLKARRETKKPEAPEQINKVGVRYPVTFS